MGFSGVMAAISLIGTGMSTVGAYQQAKAQKSQAEYNAAIATKNQERGRRAQNGRNAAGGGTAA